MSRAGASPSSTGSTPGRILICGGTFDPPHRAHVELTRAAAVVLACDKVLLIPAAINPLKSDQPPADPRHRLAMLHLALGSWRGEPRAEIETLELDRPGPSYTIDTLEELRRRLPNDSTLRLLIGSDSAVDFKHWKDWPRILELATPAIMLRPPHDRARFELAMAAAWSGDDLTRWLSWIVPLPTMDISATQVRRAIAKQNWTLAENLTGPAVLAYIRANDLYRPLPSRT
jgi:nicotinate-nucleotide adenylyltransferase